MGDRFRRGGSRGAIQAPKRQIAHGATDGAIDGLSVTTTIVKGLGSSGLQLVVAAATLVRTRGVVRVAQQTNSGVSTVIVGAWGLIVVSADAFAAGVGSVPGPVSDEASSWLAWGGLVFTQFGATASIPDPGVFHTETFDSRAMRKQKSGDVMAFVVELIADAASTTVFDIGYSYRDQLKL